MSVKPARTAELTWASVAGSRGLADADKGIAIVLVAGSTIWPPALLTAPVPCVTTPLTAWSAALKSHFGGASWSGSGMLATPESESGMRNA